MRKMLNRLLGSFEHFSSHPPDVKCPGSQTYQECGNGCQRTCKDLSQPGAICKKSCVAGCNCPPGQVLNAVAECVPIEECPCSVGQAVYKPNSVFQAPKCQVW